MPRVAAASPRLEGLGGVVGSHVIHMVAGREVGHLGSGISRCLSIPRS